MFTDQEDNIICTFIRLYSFNIRFGLFRASQYLGRTQSSVTSRYYNVLRNERQIFHVKFGDMEIWNKRRITGQDLIDLQDHEPTNIEELSEREQES